MGLFSKFSRKSSEESAYDRPSWMTDGMQASLLEGDTDLEVVGESYHQKELWVIVGSTRGERVRSEIAAMLVPEPDNPYDRNAVGVWVNGYKVGHLSRTDAADLLPGLLVLERNEGQKIALPGVIVGGHELEDGARAHLGVFLRYDPRDFGILDGDDDSDGHGWYEDLSDNDVKAISQLRGLLAEETDAMNLHFMYRELETRLYKSRDVFASALDEYDLACEAHDEAMRAIRPALLDRTGSISLLETYKQQAIRQQKAKNFDKAIWWAQRGIELYGDDAADQAWVEDLIKRKAKAEGQSNRS